MLVLLGIDSQFAMVDVLIAAILDSYPHIFRKGNRKSMVVGAICLAGFLLGFPILTNGGYHLFNLINDYSAYYGLLLLGRCCDGLIVKFSPNKLFFVMFVKLYNLFKLVSKRTNL